MCLGEIVRLESVDGAVAGARLGGRLLSVSLVTLVEPVAAGDWVVVHSGFALQRLDPDEAASALALRAGASSGHVQDHRVEPQASPDRTLPTNPQEES